MADDKRTTTQNFIAGFLIVAFISSSMLVLNVDPSDLRVADYRAILADPEGAQYQFFVLGNESNTQRIDVLQRTSNPDIEFMRWSFRDDPITKLYFGSNLVAESRPRLFDGSTEIVFRQRGVLNLSYGKYHSHWEGDEFDEVTGECLNCVEKRLYQQLFITQEIEYFRDSSYNTKVGTLTQITELYPTLGKVTWHWNSSDGTVPFMRWYVDKLDEVPGSRTYKSASGDIVALSEEFGNGLVVDWSDAKETLRWARLKDHITTNDRIEAQFDFDENMTIDPFFGSAPTNAGIKSAARSFTVLGESTRSDLGWYGDNFLQEDFEDYSVGDSLPFGEWVLEPSGTQGANTHIDTFPDEFSNNVNVMNLSTGNNGNGAGNFSLWNKTINGSYESIVKAAADADAAGQENFRFVIDGDSSSDDTMLHILAAGLDSATPDFYFRNVTGTTLSTEKSCANLPGMPTVNLGSPFWLKMRVVNKSYTLSYSADGLDWRFVCRHDRSSRVNEEATKIGFIGDADDLFYIYDLTYKELEQNIYDNERGLLFSHSFENNISDISYANTGDLGFKPDTGGFWNQSGGKNGGGVVLPITDSNAIGAPILGLNVSSTRGLTVSSWVSPKPKDSTIGVTAGFFTHGGINTYNLVLWVRNTSASGFISFCRLVDPTPTNHQVIGSTIIPVGEWSHISCTYDPDTGNITTYVDGQLDISENKPDLATKGLRNMFTVTDTQLGRPDGNGYYLGSIDDIKLWQRALSSDEVLAEFNSGAHASNVFNSTLTSYRNLAASYLYSDNEGNAFENHTLEIYKNGVLFDEIFNNADNYTLNIDLRNFTQGDILSSNIKVCDTGNECNTTYAGSWYIEELVTSSCGCPAVGSNWVINLDDSCSIETTCQIASGNITFIGSPGTVLFNSTINYTNILLNENVSGLIGESARVIQQSG